jgi:dCMP deaminase
MFIVALAVATRGECVRRRVGAVVFDRDGRIIGAGYNGSYPGGPSCLQGECPRALSAVLPGSQYDTGPGACHAVHAELNAYLDVSDKGRTDGGGIVVTARPCDGCLKILRNTQLTWVAWLDEEGEAHESAWPFQLG